MSDFRLHEQLAADSLPVCDLPLCTLRLVNDSLFPWLLLVPRLPGLVDLVDLGPQGRIVLMEEIGQACEALKAQTKEDGSRCDKLNVASLGNQVPQLHVHVIARRTDDAAWPKPVWGAAEPVPYATDDAERIVPALAARLRTAAR